MKKILAILLCVVFCFGLLSFGALAEEDSPEEGSESTSIVTVLTSGGGIITAEGLENEKITINQGESVEFTIKPDAGYAVESVMQLEDWMEDEEDAWDITRCISYKGEGELSLTTDEVFADITLKFNFIEEDIEDLLGKSYAVLAGETANENDVQTALAREFGYLGYAIPLENITVSDIKPAADLEDYGTFNFTVTVGENTSETQTGYIVTELSDVIFKYQGSYGDIEVNEIRIAHEMGEFTAPAIDTGILEIFGVHNVGLEGILSSDVKDALTPLERITLNCSIYQIEKAFYRMHLHLENRLGKLFDEGHLNWYGLDLIQDNAYCVQVSAGDNPQRAHPWELNRYAQLTTDSYTSQVFFANKEFVLSLPPEGIGAVTSFIVETGDFPGYSVAANGDGTYSVHFLSDFYNRIPLKLTINDSEKRTLIIHRVGVEIENYKNPGEGTVFHGTQYGTRLDYTDGNNYRIYATYYIPIDLSDVNGGEAPYGLYVTKTWANGTVTTEIITEPCNDPAEPELFSDGVFRYNLQDDRSFANCCDYLLYAASNNKSAPMKVNVTVLKNAPTVEDAFGGVFFGSGAGVEWSPK